jgi:hypothetical protein
MVSYSVGTDALARILAPMAGSMLYALGGYLASFYAISLTNLFFYFLLISPVMTVINCKEKELTPRSRSQVKQDNSISYCELFSVKRFFFGFLGIFL